MAQRKRKRLEDTTEERRTAERAHEYRDDSGASDRRGWNVRGDGIAVVLFLVAGDRCDDDRTARERRVDFGAMTRARAYVCIQ